MSIFSLKGKTALVTGATSGIGEACALQLAEHGVRLVICGRRKERLEALKQKLTKEHKASVHILSFDVRDQNAVNTALESLPADFKNIDILINSAGGALGLDYMDVADMKDWQDMIEMNINGMLYLIRQLLPGMYARKSGHIVNLGSTAGLSVYEGGTVYCATKAAVHAISKALSLEAVNKGVRITEIDPAAVETELSIVRFKGDVERAKNVYKNFKPLVAADVADTILFALTRPEHVNISQIVLYSREQATRIPN